MSFEFKRIEIVCSRVHARSCFSGCGSGQNMLGGRRTSSERSGIGCLLKRTAISTRRSVTNSNIDKKVTNDNIKIDEESVKNDEEESVMSDFINEERGVDSLIIEECKIDEESATNNKFDEESMMNDKIHEE